MVSYYYGNTTAGIPGLLGDPYYWWEAGAMFSALIDYWYYTGSTEYNAITTQAMLHQRGAHFDYEPENQTKSLGNDDQAFWGMAAMTAAEVGYPDPPDDQPGWLALAQAVFNRQAARWDNETCGGGFRWQIFAFNNGYDYKNSITQGSFFNIASRLYAYTGNETYAEWATKTYKWSMDVGLISSAYQVFDGTDSAINCTDLNHIQWSYNTGVYMLGAAMMFNKVSQTKPSPPATQHHMPILTPPPQTTGDTQEYWRTHLAGLVDGARFFFYETTDTMFEIACEPRANCNVDQLSFKAYLARWMAGTAKVAPQHYDAIMKRLRGSAIAAAKQCTGGAKGITCGTRWYENGWDGTYGVGQQMNALEIFQSNLEDQVAGPLSNSTGGTSKGNPNAGTGPDSASGGGGGGGGRAGSTDPITTGDRAGAGILTALVVVFVLGGAWYVVS
jgi:mannan endo-1,6-alpha-mannosidase